MADRERYSFKNLELWKAAQDFAVEVARLVDALPRTRSAEVAGMQLLRSATSIAANIAEGHGRYSRAAYRNHLSIAKGSASESESWLNFLVRLALVDEANGQALETRCASLMGALTRRMVALDQEATRGNRLREDGPQYEAAPESSWFPGSVGSMVPNSLAEEDDR